MKLTSVYSLLGITGFQPVITGRMPRPAREDRNVRIWSAYV